MVQVINQNRLLGFDIRKSMGSYGGEAWSPERRSIYLLREDIEKPLSVDSAVWPVIASGSENALEETIQIYKHLDEAVSVYEMKEKQQMRGVIIAIEALNDQISNEDDWYLLCEPASPDRLPGSWKFIGYDVADLFLLSGLSNCGYAKDEKPALQRQWKDCLNQYGLFSSLDDALPFCASTDERVSEHGPFKVYRISHSPDQLL